MCDLLDSGLLHSLGTESSLAKESFWRLVINGSKGREFCK